MRTLVVGAVLLAGCALTSKGEVLVVRWFDPEITTPTITSSSATTPRAAGPAIEIGRVTSGPHLRERIAHRESAFEVGYYEDERWTERPETYVKRAIARTLFEERSFRRAVDGTAPVLDVEVLAFEEVKGPPHRAEVRVRIVLRNGERSLVERTLTAERPIASKGIEGVVQAMAGALEDAAHDVGRTVDEATPR